MLLPAVFPDLTFYPVFCNLSGKNNPGLLFLFSCATPVRFCVVLRIILMTWGLPANPATERSWASQTCRRRTHPCGLPKNSASGSKTGRLFLPTARLSACTNMPFLLREPGSATRMVFEKALRKQWGRDISLNVIGYLESQEAIKEAAKAGLGLTVISKKAVEEELRAGLLKGYRLQDLPLKRNFYIVFRKKSILPPLSLAFFQFALEFFSNNSQTT